MLSVIMGKVRGCCRLVWGLAYLLECIDGGSKATRGMILVLITIEHRAVFQHIGIVWGSRILPPT